MKYCQKCGEPLKEGAMFCEKCGERANATNFSQNNFNYKEVASAQQANSVAGKLAIAAILVLLFCGISGLFVLFIGLDYGIDYESGRYYIAQGLYYLAMGITGASILYYLMNRTGNNR